MPFWGSSSSAKQTPDPDTNQTQDPGTSSAGYQERDLERRQSQNDPSVSASQAAGTEWLAGHLHHLTKEQEEKLEGFKKLCEERGYFTSADEEGGKDASHDDAAMLYVFIYIWLVGGGDVC